MKKIALMMLVAVAAIACQKTPEASEITVKTTDLTIPVEGSEEEAFLVEFNAPAAWTATLKEASEWCSIAPNSGAAGDAKLSVYALENELEETRSVTVVITAGAAVKEVVLTQAAVYVPRISVSPQYPVIPLAGGSVTVEVTANLEYEVSVPEDATWLTYTQDGNVLTFTAAAANESFSALSATVTFTTALEEVACTATIAQEGRATKLWTKNPSTDLDGYDAARNVKLARYGDYIAVANTTIVYLLDPVTGEVKNTINMPEGVQAHSVLVDDAGNLVIANDVAGTGDINVYYLATPTATPELLCSYNTGNYYATSTGNLRVKGNVKGNALLTAVASDGAGGAVIYWEFKDGATDGWHWTSVPYPVADIAYGCVAPAGTSLADGLFYIGYNGNANDLYYVASPVQNAASTWEKAYTTGSGWMENWNCIATADWKGSKYLAAVSGCHFNYDDAEAHLLNVDTPSSATLVYTYSGTYDIARNDDWSSKDWTGKGTYSDVLLVPTAEALLMVYVDSNFGSMSCIAIK